MKRIESLHKQWFTKEELASKLSVTPRTIYNMFSRGEVARRETSEGIQWALLHDEVHERELSMPSSPVITGDGRIESLSQSVSTCNEIHRKDDEALQEKLNACQQDLAQAQGIIRSQENELVHLRALTDAYARQREASLWSAFKRFISKLIRGVSHE